MSTQTRQPAGVPAGGQFATTHRAEVGTELDAAHAVGAVDLDAWAPGADRGEDDMDPYLLALCSDDLGDLYATGVGQAVDRLESAIRHSVDERQKPTAAAPEA